MTSSSQDFRSAKRNLRKVMGNWLSSVNSADVSRKELNRFKEADLCLLIFVEKGENLLEETGGCDEADDIKETIEDIVQNFRFLVRVGEFKQLRFELMISMIGLK